MSLQDDLGYELLISRLVGQHSVMSFRGKLVLRDIAAQPATLPSSGTTLVRGVRYLVHSFYVGHFPSGRLRVWLLVRAPARSLARQPCAQVRADEAAAIARLAYSRASTGSAVQFALNALSKEHELPVALAAGDYASASTLVTGLVGHGGFGGLQVLVGGHLVAAAGGTDPLISPVRAPILDAGGVVIARAVLAVQNASGFAYLAHYLTGDPVLVRSGSSSSAAPPGPAVLPNSGRSATAASTTASRPSPAFATRADRCGSTCSRRAERGSRRTSRAGARRGRARRSRGPCCARPRGPSGDRDDDCGVARRDADPEGSRSVVAQERRARRGERHAVNACAPGIHSRRAPGRAAARSRAARDRAGAA